MIAENTSALIAEHIIQYGRFYENGILVPSVHYRLVENAETYAGEAGIRPTDIYEPFSVINPTMLELDYVKTIARNSPCEFHGMYYVEPMDPPIVDRMRAIVGALIRNFEPAKLMTQGQLFDAIHGDVDLSDYKVLCLPDLVSAPGTISDGLRRSISTMIMTRYIAGQQICFGQITSIGKITNLFGPDIAALIETHYVKVEK